MLTKIGSMWKLTLPHGTWIVFRTRRAARAHAQYCGMVLQ
jgi:hypothetical protein